MSHALVELQKLGVEVDLIDLSVAEDRPTVQPCRGCISTAGGYHCHYPCDCYLRKDEDEDEAPDFLAEHRVFERVAKADGFMVFTPVNWYSVPTQVKAMFDRFVCTSLTLTREQAHDLMGADVKDPKLTRPLSMSGEHDDMLKNQWAGKKAAFYIHGDDGAADYKDRKEPKSLRMYPDAKSPVEPVRMAILPIVQQCRYSGIDVPDDLIVSFYFNKGLDYASANDAFRDSTQAFSLAKSLAQRLVHSIESAKG